MMPKTLALAACLLGAPLFAADPLALSGSAQALTGSAAALSGTAIPVGDLRKGFDERLPVDIQGHRVLYRQTDETLLAEGDVVLESAGAVVHADRLWYDLKQGTLRAEGQVVVNEGANTLWARHVELQQLSRTGLAQDLLFYNEPWTAACGGAQLLPGDVLLLRGCECTSCHQENPHWKLSARELKIKANDRLWAWGVWLHAGRVPVFYLPYYSQSLKDPRPPIEIKPGYTQTLGAYVRTKYNYYLGDGQYGSIRYDWMDKKGNGYGLGEHWKIPGGEGEAAGYFVRDKNDANDNGWSGNIKHKQDLGHGISLLGNLDLLSDSQFNENFDLSQVDAFQRRSFLALQGAGDAYAWTLQAGETQLEQSIPDGMGGILRRETVISEQLLPGFNLSKQSRPVRPGSALYWAVDLVAERRLITPLMLLTATAATVYDTVHAYEQDQTTLKPVLSHTLHLARGLALSSQVSLEQGWRHLEGVDSSGTDLSTGSTWFNLQARPLRFFTLDLGHRYQRQLLPYEGLRWSGELSDQVEARAQAQLSAADSLLATADYDLRPWRTDDDLKRLSLLRFQASHNSGDAFNSSLNVGLHAPTGQIKTLDAWLNANGPKQRWQLNLGLNWVNNRIVSAAPLLDPDAPSELAFEDPRHTPDQLLSSLRSTLNLGPKWRLSFFERLDLQNRRVDEQALSLYRDFNCIDTELYARQTLYGGWQFGFALSLRALPNVRVNSNQVTADLFDPVQYGY
jgi:hypothetical protein